MNKMIPPPTLLHSAHQLLPLLPLSALTVLLISTNYTHETFHVRQSLQKASASIVCPSISYYELQIHIKDLHSSPPQVPALAKLWPTYLAYQRQFQALLAHNVTSNVPWFPCLRVFQADDLSDVYTHMDGLDVGSIVRAMNKLCGKGGGERAGELVSKDEFARKTGKGEHLGVLIRSGGKMTGREVEVMKGAVERVHGEGGRRWVMSVDEEIDEIGSIHLVDVGRDIVKRIRVIGMDVERVVRELRLFEKGGRVEWRQWEGGKVGGLGDRVLRYVDKWKGWQGHLYEECEVGLKGFVEGEYGWKFAENVTIYLVVCETWCGMCQRVRVWLERVEGRLEGDGEYVVGVWGGTLPERVDRVVDGVPTVVEIREIGGILSIGELEGGIGELFRKVRRR